MKKWLIVGAVIGSFLLMTIGGALWISLLTFSRIKEYTTTTLQEGALTSSQCAQTISSLLSSEVWLAVPPKENLMRLKEGCSAVSLEKGGRGRSDENTLKLKTTID